MKMKLKMKPKLKPKWKEKTSNKSRMLFIVATIAAITLTLLSVREIREVCASDGQVYDIGKVKVLKGTCYTATFKGNKGGKAEPGIIEKGRNEAIGKLPRVSRQGYRFTGWYTAAKGGNKISVSTKLTKNVTYYAHWTAKKYKLTFDGNGGNIGNRKTVTKSIAYGKKYSLPKQPAKTNYTFQGWYTKKSGGSKVTASTTMKKTAAHVLYARWERIGADAAMNYTDFREDKTAFVNPERGWYIVYCTDDKISAKALKSYREEENIGLILLEANLSKYRSKDLDKKKLDEIKAAFDVIREANYSVIFRAAYDFDGVANPEPKKIERILGHIKQLKKIFYKNEDILYSVQAGFLGSWGEWQNSFYADPINVDTQIAVMKALQKAVPPSVSIAVRRPSYVRTINGGQTLTLKQAFSQSALSRVAYHNDAILSDETDMGTYSDKNYSRKQELVWTNNHTRYTPLVGEVNQRSKYSVAKMAVPLLEQMNVQSLNSQYSTEVLNSWKSTQYKKMNTYEYIGMNLGYRFVLQKVGFSKKIKQGGRLDLEIQLKNSGFGNLMKEKKFELILSQGSKNVRFVIDDDARLWDDDAKTLIKRYKFNLPKTMQTGEWEASLSLSSTFDSLSGNPLYAVRFANKNVWDATHGWNKIGTITIRPN
ncbi:DUF4832 domain-containing protein [Lachnospiraceae bacterium ZAX-1]